MLQESHVVRRLSKAVWSVPAWAVFVMGPWGAPLAQNSQCIGTDLTCLEADRDTHTGSCLNLSYKRITLAGRDLDNMRVGWYAYSHRGGGFMPLDVRSTPVWENIILDLELLRAIEPPLDEVNACLLYNLRSCYGQRQDVPRCIAAHYIRALPDECELTLSRMSLPVGSPAQWFGSVPGREALVPLIHPGDSAPHHSTLVAFSRYGGFRQVLRWLELPETVGIDEVNVCELRTAHECYASGEYAGDVNFCAEFLITDK